MKVEVCSTSIQGIKNAAKAGADRIELCSGIELGGLTPSKGLIEQSVKLGLLDIHCLIRPRAGHFSYTKEEVEIIEQDILFAREIGCRGIVIGALTTDFKLDLSLLKRWRMFAGSMYFTFHRAIDLVIDPFSAIKQLIKINVDCILSSGQKEKAIDGLNKLKLWNQNFGDKIHIMPGSGVNKENCKLFKSEGFGFLHLSGSKKIPSISIPFGVNSEISFLKHELSECNISKIQDVVNLVKS